MKRLAYRPLQAAVRLCARAADAVIATDSSLRPGRAGAPRRRRTAARDHPERDRRRTPPHAGLTRRRTRSAAARRHRRARMGAAVRRQASRRTRASTCCCARWPARASAPPWRWVLVGHGPWRDKLARAVAASGLASRIMMRGREDETTLHAWYEAAQAFVHPTLYEGSSLVTLEAMAHGLPVVATRAGGLPDKVRPGQNGWLVAPGDPDELAQALARGVRGRRSAARLRGTLPRHRGRGVRVARHRRRDPGSLPAPARGRARAR